MNLHIRNYLIRITWKGVRIIKNPSKQLFEDMRRYMTDKYIKDVEVKYGAKAYDDYLKSNNK